MASAFFELESALLKIRCRDEPASEYADERTYPEPKKDVPVRGPYALPKDSADHQSQ
jgi:hypothetical protein